MTSDKLPTISVSVDDDRTHLDLRDDDAVQPELKMCVHAFDPKGSLPVRCR
jgi:hypothetical protein